MSTEALQALRLTTAHFSGRDNIEAFRENYGRALMQLEISPLPGFAFELDFTVRAIPGFSIASGRLSPTHNRHTNSMIGDDDIVLVYTSQGCGSLRQSGREVTIRDGEATLVSNGLAGDFVGHVPSRLCNLRFSRALLSSMAGRIDDALLRKIRRDDPALRLLAGYAGVLNDAEALAAPELHRSIALHMHDLASLLMGATRDGARAAARRGVRAARMRAVQADIAAHLTERELSIATLCARQGLSPRAVRALFHGEGTTFADYVLQQRLVRVHRQLTDPSLASTTISALAFEAGFGDLSYFNHAFRRCYGATPSDVRAMALSVR